jgi:cytochrome P450
MTRDRLLNPLDPETLEDPFVAYEHLRRTDPIYWHEELASWVLTRYADCKYVLGHPDLFVSDWRKVGVPTPAPLLTIQTLDPPEHTPYRRLVVRGLRSQELQGIEVRLGAFARARLAELEGMNSFDFVSEFASPVALAGITQLLGVAMPDLAWFTEVSTKLVRSMDSGLDPDTEAPGLRARAELSALVAQWLEQDPETGLLGHVLRSPESRDVSRSVLINTIRVVLHAGFESWGRFLANAAFHLISEPDGAEQIRSSPHVKRAIEELVRFDGSVQAESRAVAWDCQLGERKLARGDVVIVLLGAANHDSTTFRSPDRLVLTRHQNPHLGFGYGVHACPGAAVSVQLSSAVIKAMLSRYPQIRLAGSPKRKPNATLRGFELLPVSLHA